MKLRDAEMPSFQNNSFGYNIWETEIAILEKRISCEIFQNL